MYLDVLDRALGLDSERREGHVCYIFVSEGLRKKPEPSKFQMLENLRILIVMNRSFHFRCR
jgi:hypothetical protein